MSNSTATKMARVTMGWAWAIALAACETTPQSSEDVAGARNQPTVAGPQGSAASPAAAALARAEAVIDTIKPGLDAAMRQAGGIGYDELRAKLEANLGQAGTPEGKEVLRALERQYAPIVKQALEANGLSEESLRGKLKAAIGDDLKLPAAAAPASPQAPEGFLYSPACEGGYQYEPLPPFYETASWGWGWADRSNGRMHSGSEANLGGAPRDGAWLRADFITPAITRGYTTVTSTFNLYWSSVFLTAYLPAYVRAGVYTRLIIKDGITNTVVAECERMARDIGIGWGYVDEKGPLPLIQHQCSFWSAPDAYYKSYSQLETFATAVGPGYAAASADAYLQSVYVTTCF